MIQKVLYEILKRDITDSDPGDALALIQAKFPDVASIEGFEHYYLSLKTLLEDPETDWAERKIFYEKYERNYDNWVGKKSEFPIIGIGLVGNLDKADNNSMREMNCQIKITVRSPQTDSSLTRKILLRVKNNIEILNQDHWTRRHFCEDFFNYSISNFTLTLNRIDEWVADHASIIYNCTFHFV